MREHVLRSALEGVEEESFGSRYYSGKLEILIQVESFSVDSVAELLDQAISVAQRVSDDETRYYALGQAAGLVEALALATGGSSLSSDCPLYM